MEASVKVEIPDGWELACDRLRRAEFGEHVIGVGTVEKWTAPYQSDREYVIVRKVWQWPEWLKAAAIVQSSSDSWYACKEIPQRSDTARCGWDLFHYWSLLDPKLIDFTPPSCVDWRDSLRINPNMKGRDDAE